LSLSTPWRHTERAEVHLSFLTSALDGSKWSFSRPGRFTPEKEPWYPCLLWNTEWKVKGTYEVKVQLHAFLTSALDGCVHIIKPFNTKWPLKLIQIIQGVTDRHPNFYEPSPASSVWLSLRDPLLLKHEESSGVHSCPIRQTQTKIFASPSRQVTGSVSPTWIYEYKSRFEHIFHLTLCASLIIRI
jgi:hypothetical protein